MVSRTEVCQDMVNSLRDLSWEGGILHLNDL